MSSAPPAPTRCGPCMPSPRSEVACYLFRSEHLNHQVCLEKLSCECGTGHVTQSFLLLQGGPCRGSMMRTLSCMELILNSVLDHSVQPCSRHNFWLCSSAHLLHPVC